LLHYVSFYICLICRRRTRKVVILPCWAGLSGGRPSRTARLRDGASSGSSKHTQIFHSPLMCACCIAETWHETKKKKTRNIFCKLIVHEYSKCTQETLICCCWLWR
jgi:hypothetical protein